MSAMRRERGDEELPAAIEEQASEILLGPPDLIESRFEVLCRANEAHRPALLRLRTDFQRAAHLLRETGGEAPGPLPTAIGPYHILRQLGEGAFGVVFLAEQQQPIRREVAIKLLHTMACSPSTIARFLNERETLARMNHPAIARIFDAGVDGHGRPFFVREYVPGEPLHRFVATRAADLGARIELFLAACEGVNHAHQRGVIHRDLKPHNILVAEVDGKWLPKVIDFGLAKVLERDGTDAVQTRAGAVLGTPAYMSPEQLRGDGHAADTRTDVYALGVILHELLTTSLPLSPEQYRGKRFAELQRALLAMEPPLASLRAEQAGMPYARSLRGDLDRVLQKAMAKHEDERYASVAEFAGDLRRYLAHEPVRAGPPSTFYTLRKFVRRHRGAVLATALVALSLVLGLVTSAIAWQRSSADAERAQARLADFWRLADVIELEDLIATAAKLWPSSTERLAEHEAWLERARELVAHRAMHTDTVAVLQHRNAAPAAAPLEQRGAMFLLASLQKHLASLDSFTAAGGVLQDVERRTAFARSVRRRSIDEVAEAWDRAIDRIAESPLYGGMLMRRAPGLVPLGPDPVSGLEEFAHLQSGRAAERGADGRLGIGDDTGIVLVLIPGGDVAIGSQAEDAQRPHHDPHRQRIEDDYAIVRGTPFLLAKYELTQGQVQALGLAVQALGHVGAGNLDAPPYSLRHPEESIQVPVVVQWLPHFELRLPSRLEWEVAARAGSGRIWGVGDTVESLAGFANVADASFADAGLGDRRHDGRVRDGFLSHAPVGSFAPNAYGLHDVLGNVAELTVSAAATGGVIYMARGGSYMLPPLDCRIGATRQVMVNQTTPEIGLRVARSVACD